MNKNSFKFFESFRNNSAYQDIAKPIIIAWDLRMPENMGLVLRLAGNIGALETIFVSDMADKFRNYKINRTSSGADKKTPWRVVPSDNIDLHSLVPEGYSIYAIETSSDAISITSSKLPEKCAFMIGNETYGIPDKILKQSDKTVFIPIHGPISSLNVSHALSITLFEWLRQRKIEFYP
jgi:tRNA G18 (ribose-2'-O)-methylase SpoU